MTAWILTLLGAILAIVCGILEPNLIKGTEIVRLLKWMGVIMFSVGLVALFWFHKG
jgi:hypothetical protein